MANEEHLAILRQGVAALLQRRDADIVITLLGFDIADVTGMLLLRIA